MNMSYYISLGNDEVPFVLENFQRISEGDDFSQIVLLPSFPSLYNSIAHDCCETL